MKNSWLSKVKKGIALGLAVGMTMVSTIVPVLADEVQQPQISRWSIGTLNEGEKYGIYPMAWYADEFQKSIPEDKFNILLKNVEDKLSELELQKDEAFIPIAYEKDATRGSVLIALYNSVAKYQLPAELESSKNDAIEYMKKRSILKGTDKGLELEKACTVEQAAVFASKVLEDTYSMAQAGAKGLMWTVSKGENTIYLLGSIHIGESDLYPLHPAVKDAFKQSDMLIVEANLLGGQEGMEAFTQLAMYADGTSLLDHVSQETYAKCIKVFEQYGLPTELYNQFKPWAVSNNLAVLTSSDSDSVEEAAEAATLGIDMYFLTTGMLTGKPVMELEGLVYQAELFNGISPEIQEENLNGVLDEILSVSSEASTDSADALSGWLEQWRKGDIDSFKTSYSAAVGEEQGEYEKMLFGKRDQDMADKLTKLLEKDGKTTYFVVVGAGHFVTEGTVIDQLQSKGYVVERFWK